MTERFDKRMNEETALNVALVSERCAQALWFFTDASVAQSLSTKLLCGVGVGERPRIANLIAQANEIIHFLLENAVEEA